MKARKFYTERENWRNKQIDDYVMGLGLSVMAEVIREQLNFGTAGRLTEFIQIFHVKHSDRVKKCHFDQFHTEAQLLCESAREDCKDIGFDYFTRDGRGAKMEVARAQDYAFMESVIILHRYFKVPAHGRGNMKEKPSKVVMRMFNSYCEKIKHVNTIINDERDLVKDERLTIEDWTRAHLESIGLPKEIREGMYTFCGYDPRVVIPHKYLEDGHAV